MNYILQKVILDTVPDDEDSYPLKPVGRVDVAIATDEDTLRDYCRKKFGVNPEYDIVMSASENFWHIVPCTMEILDRLPTGLSK